MKIILLVIGWAMVEYALWRSDPEREQMIEAAKEPWRIGWAKFIYEDMNYGRGSGELDHWL